MTRRVKAEPSRRAEGHRATRRAEGKVFAPRGEKARGRPPGSAPRGGGPRKGPDEGAARPAERGAEPMRIVGGRFKGRALAAPRRATSARPRTGCARRFSTSSPIALPTVSKARACSTCSPAPARSGSRRCRAARRSALFVDNGVEARALIRDNVEALALGGVTRIFRADATKLGKAPAGPAVHASPFSIRPMGRASPVPRSARSSRAAGSRRARSSSSRRPRRAEIAAPADAARLDERRYGDAQIAHFRLSADEEAAGGAG